MIKFNTSEGMTDFLNLLKESVYGTAQRPGCLSTGEVSLEFSLKGYPEKVVLSGFIAGCETKLDHSYDSHMPLMGMHGGMRGYLSHHQVRQPQVELDLDFVTSKISVVKQSDIPGRTKPTEAKAMSKLMQKMKIESIKFKEIDPIFLSIAIESFAKKTSKFDVTTREGKSYIVLEGAAIAIDSAEFTVLVQNSLIGKTLEQIESNANFLEFVASLGIIEAITFEKMPADLTALFK